MPPATDLDPRRVEPPHGVTDDAKLFALNASMTEHGWIGAPIVIVERDGDPLAITGSHRLAAAREVGLDIPAVSLADLLAEHGADLADLVADFEAAGLDHDSAIYEAAIRAVDHLPAEVCEHYGLDLH